MDKISRRTAITAGAASLVAMQASSSAEANDDFRPVPTKDGFTTLSPDEALEYLIEGNRAFLAGSTPNPPIGRERRLELAKGQAPFCAYVTCSDSRVPPELLFGRGLGELFIIRNAGNTVDTAAMGSIEYAVAVLKVPLVVVMGHEACGAVDAARRVIEEDTRFPGAIGDMILPILPAALAARDAQGKVNLKEAIHENVRRVVHRLRHGSDPILMDPQREGRLKVVGAYYSLEGGVVSFFDVP